MIDILQQFADHADKMTTGITSLYQPEKEILVEPEDIEKVPRIKDALQVHMVRRLFNILKFPYLEFFNLTTEKPSFTQYYGQYTTCGHKRNSIVDSHGVFVKPIISQLKNGFITRFVRLVFTMIASVCDYQSNDNKFLHFDI